MDASLGVLFDPREHSSIERYLDAPASPLERVRALVDLVKALRAQDLRRATEMEQALIDVCGQRTLRAVSELADGHCVLFPLRSSQAQQRVDVACADYDELLSALAS